MCTETPVSPHSSTGLDSTELSVQIQQGSHAVNSPTMVSERRREGFKEQTSFLREGWMTHKDQICSLQNTLLAVIIFFIKKATATPMALKISKNLFRKMVKVSSSSKIL